ncbi:ribonucleotide reductase beta subunit family protein with ferritin-like domain [Aquimarina sp. EL_43]|uniref:hypothetical protein n=1 Tax=unclassified Aquimarina TaxID=2627091 RepID=UPI0018CB1AF2|nr:MULTISPECIES: hypothetical protein [unclassified Aquimarina]MBG6131779.1 ribonucleotide reductase beta subunit family protein with ferritin-like domain [Aquimarina sp. EL_35]MBG6149343.1 ribonucleotide reductase beta subunit family protein with ferritin-like domain [Aquimarina sp. EL_32]MBG6170394.1 ribonucleotide reductase beta subunit family protein with ferritin-like domain [Aquimarina sp. EL_43]
MAISSRTPISGLLSKLLKDTLTASQIRAIAKEHNVHYNTIVNIRDRRKKDPNKQILKDMIRMAISHQKQTIENSKVFLQQLEKELERLM